jgi:hypothetical protein
MMQQDRWLELKINRKEAQPFNSLHTNKCKTLPYKCKMLPYEFKMLPYKCKTLAFKCKTLKGMR